MLVRSHSRDAHDRLDGCGHRVAFSFPPVHPGPQPTGPVNGFSNGASLQLRLIGCQIEENGCLQSHGAVPSIRRAGGRRFAGAG